MLGSSLIWRLTGLTYATAVVATAGRYIPEQEYVKSGWQNVAGFADELRGKRVLEFGCGLGRNLFALSGFVSAGVGIDVNAGYVKIARRLARKHGFPNLDFVAFDGKELPGLGKFGGVIEIGVFERLPKPYVRNIVKELREKYAEEGTVFALYFLAGRAKGSEFTRRLGDSAYVFWEDPEVRELLSSADIGVSSVLEWKWANVYVGKALRGSDACDVGTCRSVSDEEEGGGSPPLRPPLLRERA
jgi:SAM-dependent methyltransferase